MGVLGTDHPEQATDSALLEVWVVIGQHQLSIPGNDTQPRRLAQNFRQFAGDSHHMMDEVSATDR